MQSIYFKPNQSVSDQRHFLPPYCPNAKCRHHQGFQSLDSFRKSGFNKIKRFPYFSQRFQCKDCKRVFVGSIFDLDFGLRKIGIFERVFYFSILGISNREISRVLRVSECTIRHRLRRLAQQSYLWHTKMIENLSIEELIVYDGLENFSFSQYDPNNINQAVGSDSKFIYDFGFSPMNRRGMMSDFQKLKKKRIEDIHGKYPPNAIQSNTAEIIERLLKRTRGKKLQIVSDEHYQYRKALSFNLKKIKHQIIHETYSAKKCRNYQNPLFPINHSDLMTRQKLACFKRETISFSKKAPTMIDKFMLFAIEKNYMRSIYVKKHKNDPSCNVQSPSMRLKISKKIETFNSFFKYRLNITQVKLSKEWESLYLGVQSINRSRNLLYPLNYAAL